VYLLISKAGLTALRERVEQLEKAVAQAADEKAELTLSLEAAVAELQPTPEDNPLPVQTPPALSVLVVD
jgi:single-stranded DNA-specific DHH superfamily exonuclease